MTMATKVKPAGVQQPYVPMRLSLPTEKSKIESDISRFSFFIYGVQKIGKTTFTAQFPEALHMMFEPGAKTESIYQVAPNNWKETVEYIRMINADTRFKNVIIDTVDLMFDMCSKEVCVEAGVEMLSEIGFGDGYSKVGNKFRQALIDIHSKRGLICLAHSKDKMKKSDSEPDFILPSTMATGAKTIGKWVDLTGHYYINNKGERMLRIRPSLDMEAGTRIKHHFMFEDGTPIQDIPMGTSEDEAYKNFVDAFNNKLVIKKVETKPKFIINK